MIVFQKLYKLFLFVLKCLFRILTLCIPIDEKKILFMAFHGRGILDNPKAIYLEFISEQRFEDYSIIWVLNDKTKELIPRGKTVRYQSLFYFYYLAKSKYWIVNCKLPEYVHKKKDQIYIQTWHGVPLKKIGMDVVENFRQKSRSGRNAVEIKQSYFLDAQRYNYMISPNSFCTRVFQSAFGVKKSQLLEIGYPRNDILYSPSPEYIDSLKEKYHIPKRTKVLLYAPTWRDDDYKIEGYTFHLKVDFELWREVLGNYVVLFKPHYFIVNEIMVDPQLKNFVRIIDPKIDINELYLISDCLVTDYSSVFFDFALLNRPIYFYMYDLVKYEKKLRGFYLDLYKDLPGEIYKTEKEMLQDIKYNKFDYKKLYEFNLLFNSSQTGNCSRKLLDLIFK